MNKHELVYKISEFIDKEYEMKYYFNISLYKSGFEINMREYVCRQEITINSICYSYKSFKDIKSFIRKRFSEIGILSKNEKMIKDIIE
jgi:hypothetical protein